MVRPEERAREKIDKMLEDSGWVVQDYSELDLGAGLGVAVREFQLGKEAADYVLFIDRQPIGAVEAKKMGHTLTGVTKQSERYLEGIVEKFPNAIRKPPFSYETTGIETQFTDRRDPKYRSREVFSFHSPDILADWLKEEKTLRGRLKDIPKLDYQNLWDCQREAIINLEKSFAMNKPRALVQMATGSGKTFTAVTAIYRLIKFAKAKRVLFLVDRANLGRQALREFQQYETPDDGRKFTDLYTVQHLQSQTIGEESVVISTVQRLFSILSGKKDFDGEGEEVSEFEEGKDNTELDVEYNSDIPIGKFDFIVIDECHRSIYNKWKQVLDYFDAFLIGLTATPSKDTIGFFKNNQVMTYPHERAVADGVNVSYHVYTIETKISTKGSEILAGETIEKRDKMTRKKRYETLVNDYKFHSSQLEKDVTVPDQIRLVMKTFKENLLEIFPGRDIVPKTLVFAKNDAHAEDITRITREVFDEGNEFCEKITYKTADEKPENLIKSFRISENPRIAVTVDMIATGTDIKPLECILFLRDVHSEVYFDQMKGRGTRTIKVDDLRHVTRDAKAKDHFVIVDAVGVCEHAKSDTHSLHRKKGVSFKDLMQTAAEGRADEDTLKTLAYRMSRLDRNIDDVGREKIKQASNGLTISQIINKILDGVDTDKQIQKAKNIFNTDKPSKEQLDETIKDSVSEASKIFDSAHFRRTILDVKSQNEMIIDTVSIDQLVNAGFNEQAEFLSKKTIESFKEFLEKNKNELIALEIIYSKSYKARKITFKDIKDLANAIENPPYNLTPELIWESYKNLDKSKVKNNPVKILADLISIVRYSIGKDKHLAPFSEIVNEKFARWLSNQESIGRKFTDEQKEWLEMIKNHIASSTSITLENMDYMPFNQRGGRVKFSEVFKDNYEDILEELQAVLVTQ